MHSKLIRYELYLPINDRTSRHIDAMVGLFSACFEGFTHSLFHIPPLSHWQVSDGMHYQKVTISGYWMGYCRGEMEPVVQVIIDIDPRRDPNAHKDMVQFEKMVREDLYLGENDSWLIYHEITRLR